MTEVELEVNDRIAVVTLNVPPVNAISIDEMEQLTRTFRGLRERRDVRVVILTGYGKSFCAGVNLKAVRVGETPILSAELDINRKFREACWAIYDCPLPVIGAVNGVAIGAGLVLAAVCDVLVASEKASFATTEINVGLLGAYTHLKMLVGRYNARKLFFSGEFISPSELKALGAVSSVAAPEKLLEEALLLAEKFVAKSPYALRLAKEAMNETEYLPLKEAYEIEQRYTERLMRLGDSGEARNAFFEKRNPVWEWDSGE